MMQSFHEVSRECSKITTEKYSTSFASAIKLLHKELRTPIYNIYGFVRFADEIVDTFHDIRRFFGRFPAQFEPDTAFVIDAQIALRARAAKLAGIPGFRDFS